MSNSLYGATVIIFTLLLIEVAPGLPTQRRLVGGRNASPGQFPWYVRLEGYRSYYFFFQYKIACGGTLISQRHVLSAAHCVIRTEKFGVILGQVNNPGLADEGLEFQVPGHRAVPHPQYDSETNENDIAVIALIYSIYPTAFIHPIRLPELWEDSINLNGRIAVVAGFGKTRDDQLTSYPVLQYSRLRILPQQKCEEFYMENFDIPISRSQICTTYVDNVSAVCSGDSGGPLIVYDTNGVPTLVGVVSLGVIPCEEGEPSIYTAVSYYIPWINQVTVGQVR